jgi:hypothetical protein
MDAPAVWTQAAEEAGIPRGAYLAWVFQTQDCLECEEIDYPIRRSQRRYRGLVPFLAIHLGSPTDSAIPIGYFRERRMEVARVIHIRTQDTGTWIPSGWPVPGLYVVDAGRITWAAGHSVRVGPAGDVDEAVALLIESK